MCRYTNVALLITLVVNNDIRMINSVNHELCYMTMRIYCDCYYGLMNGSVSMFRYN